MRIASMDVETTGLDPDKNHTLELGIVLYDSDKHGKKFDEINFADLPRLCIRLIHDYESLNPADIPEIVLEMNKRLIDPLMNSEIDNGSDYIYLDPEAIQAHIFDFLLTNEFITYDEFSNQKMTSNRLNVAGKNFAGFDQKFFSKFIDLKCIRFRQRVLDPAILYVDMNIDEELPSLQKCMDRSGLFTQKIVAHTAVEDAEDTLKLILFKILT